MATEPNGELRRNSQWQLALSALVVAGGIVSWVYSVASKVDRHDSDLAAITQQNTRSIDERAQLSKEVAASKTDLAKLQTDLATEVTTRSSANVEFETQVDATTQLFMGEISGLHRVNAIAWLHIKGLGAYPSGPFVQPMSQTGGLNERKPGTAF